MWFFHHALISRIPGSNAIVHTNFYHGKYFFQPIVVAADAPIAVDFHDATQLPICRRMKIVVQRADRQSALKFWWPSSL